MKTLLISRSDGSDPNNDQDQGTFGSAQLLDDLGYVLGRWVSLELPWRNNAPMVSCILPGVYQATLEYSPHFNRVLFHLQNVPGRSYVEIHMANWAGDKLKGWWSDLDGCIALGLHRGIIAPPKTGKIQNAILQSNIALDQFMELAGPGDIRVDVRAPVPA